MFRRALALVACSLLCGTLFAAEPSGAWLDVPFVKQEKNACGAASLAMVMRYWESHGGKPASADAEEIHRLLYSPQARGVYASDMKHYLEARGFQVIAFAGTWDDLRDQVKKGRPLIVALDGGSGDLHYVVVAGLDWSREIILKNDPAERKLLKQGRSSFERAWNAAGNWTLLAVPRQDDAFSVH